MRALLPDVASARIAATMHRDLYRERSNRPRAVCPALATTYRQATGTGTLWVLLLCATGVLLGGRAAAQQSAAGAAQTATYVGAQACVPCHASEFTAWQQSQHAAAMQKALPTTVLGDFSNAHFDGPNREAQFFQREGGFWVRAKNAEGVEQAFRAAYTFGVEPLQQYLLELPRGQLQAFDIAWDSRPRDAGGQRWFSLNAAPEGGGTEHWTDRTHNWNGMCADCHSTHVQKRYSPSDDRFDTAWSSVDVACEACHGPGSEHVVSPATRTLALARVARTWTGPGPRGIASRLPAEPDRHEIETCARCHSRRSQLSETFAPGEPLLDAYRPALLEPGLYHSDGQILGEVYVYGSFLQSAMYRAGVTCTDCHDPHTARLRATGNALCAQCHDPQRFDTPAHHHHEAGSAGTQCIACHMPVRLYMVVDERRDHSFRIPRPDLSIELDTPNPCTQCHMDRDAVWATASVASWRAGETAVGPHFGQALAAGRRWGSDRSAKLRSLAADTQAPAIARATALELMGAQLDAQMRPVIEAGLRDPEPLVQLGALTALGSAPLDAWIDPLSALLTHPRLAVREEAAQLLAPYGARLESRARTALDAALEEYRATQAMNRDQPEGHYNLGRLAVGLGQLDAGETELRAAIAEDPLFAPAYVNLADLLRQRGEEARVADVLRDAEAAVPDDPTVLLASALALVRQGHTHDAMRKLERATKLAPDDPSYSYVYALASYSIDGPDRAVGLLRDATRRFPGYRASLLALTTMLRDQGQTEQALDAARELLVRFPADAQARALLEQLSEMAQP